MEWLINEPEELAHMAHLTGSDEGRRMSWGEGSGLCTHALPAIEHRGIWLMFAPPDTFTTSEGGNGNVSQWKRLLDSGYEAAAHKAGVPEDFLILPIHGSFVRRVCDES